MTGHPDFSVEGKVVIVTGGSKGIGRALARGFAASGATVAVAARTVADLEAVANEIEAGGGQALVAPTNVTKSAQVSGLVQKVMERFGRIDVLVNCAGGGIFVPSLDLSEEAWDDMVDYNLKSVYLCCRAVGEMMVKQRSGSIINFSSGAAATPTPALIHYCAAKAGVDQFTRVLAAEWGPHNVRVNAISPGLINTQHNVEIMGAAMLEQYAKMIPLGRVGEPEDILGLAIFLASEASAFITGAIIPVSGGPQR